MKFIIKLFSWPELLIGEIVYIAIIILFLVLSILLPSMYLLPMAISKVSGKSISSSIADMSVDKSASRKKSRWRHGVKTRDQPTRS